MEKLDGDFEYASFIAMLVGFLRFEAGQPLDRIEPELARYTEAMRVFRQDVGLMLHCICHQAALNLMGRSADPLRLTGEVSERLEAQKLTAAAARRCRCSRQRGLA